MLTEVSLKLQFCGKVRSVIFVSFVSLIWCWPEIYWLIKILQFSVSSLKLWTKGQKWRIDNFHKGVWPVSTKKINSQKTFWISTRNSLAMEIIINWITSNLPAIISCTFAKTITIRNKICRPGFFPFFHFVNRMDYWNTWPPSKRRIYLLYFTLFGVVGWNHILFHLTA